MISKSLRVEEIYLVDSVHACLTVTEVEKAHKLQVYIVYCNVLLITV